MEPAATMTVGSYEAKGRLSELLSWVELTGCHIVITKRRKPIARLVPFSQQQEQREDVKA